MKNVFYWIAFVVISGVCYFWQKNYTDYFSSADFLHPVSIEYLDYNKERDFIDLDNLMEKYKFWLFHGDFKKGECPLYPNFENQTYENDFDPKITVPYFIKIARIDGHVVGFITYYISENLIPNSNEVVKKLGRIHLLCVHEGYRRLGIAKKLVEDATHFFQKNNCQRIYLITRPENVRAKSLYYKLGFNEVSKDKLEKNIFDKNPADILIKEL